MSYVKTLAKQLVPQKYIAPATGSYLQLRSVFYSGSQYICPCCNGKFRALMPLGGSSRPNAVCPKCDTLERHRVLWLYIKNRTNLFSDRLKVLHIAPEFIFKKVLKSLQNIEYIGAGIAAPFADVEMDITDIKYDDNSFDVIICNHVLEHVMEDHKAMSEFFRVLKPGGWAILQVPVDRNRETTFEDPSITSPQDRIRFFGKDDHVRVYGLDYKQRLEKAGFKVQVENYIKELDAETIDKYCLQDVENIYLCTKQA